MNDETWPETATLYQPCELLQGLMHENASVLAVQTYLKMCNLPCSVRIQSNAEFMSTQGRLSKLPLLQLGSNFLAEFQPIATYIAEAKVVSLQDIEDELWTYVTYAENTFTMAELYVSFNDHDVYVNITAPRVRCAFPWPLNHIRAMVKRRQCLRLLRSYQWDELNQEEVVEKLEKCCRGLCEKFKETDGPYFGGERPCELDALTFGHVFTMLTTRLSNEVLAKSMLNFTILIELCCHIEKEYFKPKKPG